MINSVYNYLAVSQLIGRTPRTLSRQSSTRGRSELQQIYNTIINLNKNTPLYLVKLSDTNQNHVLGIKEASMTLHSTLSDISTVESSSVFAHQKAYSDNENSASVSIATTDYEKLPKPFDLKVDSLASTQINTSMPLYTNGRGPSAGSYRFTINIEDTAYEFQFQIAPNTQNHEVQTKLADFINQTNIGIHASQNTNENNDQISLILESDSTGNPNGLIFRLKDNNTSDDQIGLVEFYDLNNITTYPENAKFQLNGEPKESVSNHFTLNQSLTISLHKASNQPFSVGYTPDAEPILNSLTHVIDNYNHLIDLAANYPSKQHLSSKLVHDITTAISPYSNQLESCGLTSDENGRWVLDHSLALQAIQDGDMKGLFTTSGLVPSLMNKLDSITINPMEYVDKTIVSYPNTAKPGLGKSYITSMYSGMFFNYYC